MSNDPQLDYYSTITMSAIVGMCVALLVYVALM
ncbi:hypothetical protein PBI_BIGNUZ_31 [Mycobacterium phage BigNuz]|uniref:YnhF family membrane protein n=2 Tax=Bignuzvirus bignuz TaxID=1983736 RepID=G1JX46_9CAUD|nr:hypothetical protein PBI_BIGNUZ_31 [Mycobacterium phage BigNuz]AEL98194.1 hypothetical protein PBI_BIGNUZ_31 [Mycobacterium phage BigNuz]AOT24870.1 hypothetical protein PBI_NAZO_31 [Mycobacterium phage Nazo]